MSGIFNLVIMDFGPSEFLFREPWSLNFSPYNLAIFLTSMQSTVKFVSKPKLVCECLQELY